MRVEFPFGGRGDNSAGRFSNGRRRARQSHREVAYSLLLQLGAYKGKKKRVVREKLALPCLSLPSPAVVAKGGTMAGGGGRELGGFKSARD